MKHYYTGFTLVELLVVIAIIGILSSVVLASLSTARNKGADAAIKANLSHIRAQAEIINTGMGYASACFDTGIINAVQGSLDAARDTGDVADHCFSDTNAWVAWSPLKTEGFWCVDISGVSKGYPAGTTMPNTAGQLCP